MRYTWKITPLELQEYTKSRKPLVKQWRKAQMHCNMMVDCAEILKGFNENEDDMYEEELKDLKITYNRTLESVSGKMECILPILIERMKTFIELYETKETIESKLATLKAKMGDEDGNEA